MRTPAKRSACGSSRSAIGTPGSSVQQEIDLEEFVLDSGAMCDVRLQGFKKAFTHAARHCGCRVIRLRPDPKAGGNWVEATMLLGSSLKIEELGDAQRLVRALFSEIGCMPITWCVESSTNTRKVVLNLHLPDWVEV